MGTRAILPLTLLMPTPHTTHILQPLDKVMYGPLKAAYSSAVTTFSYTRRDFIVSKTDFARKVREPLDKTFTPATIKKSFKCTGIYPFNADAIDKTQLYPKKGSQW